MTGTIINDVTTERPTGWTAPADSLVAQTPLPYGFAVGATLRCVAQTVGLLARRRIYQPSTHVGMRLRFANGTSAPVYRETVVDDGVAADPCVLVVAFKLHFLRGWGHALFRWESLLNTPLFVGYAGFTSKLWLAHDEQGVYRGVYEWDGAARAEQYARSLWRVLALGSVPGSIHYKVLPGLHRDDLVAAPQRLEVALADASAWWRLVEAG